MLSLVLGTNSKKLVVEPGQHFTSIEKGVYSILVWQGQGEYDGHMIEAGNFNRDELLVTYRKATQPLRIKNTGKQDLIIFKFFGPDINLDVPGITPYRS